MPGTGKAAEDTVISFFQKNFPNVEVRPATGAEDSDDRMSGGRSIDAVAYRDGKPALGIQVTTTPDPRVRDEKYLAMMRNEPYLRLSEMKPADPSIPRVLIHLDNNEVVRYLADQNFDQHPKIGEQILTGAINSLKFAATRSRELIIKESANFSRCWSGRC